MGIHSVDLLKPHHAIKRKCENQQKNTHNFHT